MNVQELGEEEPVSQGSSVEQVKRRGVVGVTVWGRLRDIVLRSLNSNQTTQKTQIWIYHWTTATPLTINQQEMLPHHRMQPWLQSNRDRAVTLLTPALFSLVLV